MSKRPNILVIMTDQQNANMLSCTGNRYLKTPAMDYLAQNGIRFERAYCTNAVCMPSRFSLMTGRMPSYVNVRKNCDSKLANVPEHIFNNGIGRLLKNAGYDAVYGGKVHLPGFGPRDLGFDVLTADQRDELADACSAYIRNHDGEKPFFMVASFINPHDICFMAIRDFAQMEGIDPGRFMPKGMTSDRLAEGLKECINLLCNNTKGASVMNEVLGQSELYDPEYFYTEICPPLPANHDPQENEPEAVDMLLDERPFRRYARENYSERQWRLHRWLYCRLTEIVDRQIWKLIDALRENRKEKDTVVIFTSDHGDHDGTHKLEHKSTLYEEVCRIPLIIVQGGGTKGGIVNNSHLVSNGLDLIPTICDYAGIVHPENDLEGMSLRPLAAGTEPENWRKALKVESETGNAIISGDYKYALYFEGRNREQLYDLRNDPGEMRNFVNDRDKHQVVRDIREEFEKAFGRYM